MTSSNKLVQDLKAHALAFLSVQHFMGYEKVGLFSEDKVQVLLDSGLSGADVKLGMVVHSLISEKTGIPVVDLGITVEKCTRDMVALADGLTEERDGVELRELALKYVEDKAPGLVNQPTPEAPSLAM